MAKLTTVIRRIESKLLKTSVYNQKFTSTENWKGRKSWEDWQNWKSLIKVSNYLEWWNRDRGVK